MKRKMVNKRRGLTLTELMVTTVIAPIVVLGTGVLLVDSQRGWSAMYDRLHGDIAADGCLAINAFEAVVRKSSIKRGLVGADEVELYYYQDPQSSTQLDRYARFHVTGHRELVVDYGMFDSAGNKHGQPQTVKLARNVESVEFSALGVCVQMALRLNDGSRTLTVMSSAVRHNE